MKRAEQGGSSGAGAEQREADYEGAYRELRERVTALVQASSEEDLDRTAPATPDWRVRDILGHLAGVCDDVSHGRLEGAGTDNWTDLQVIQRRDWSTDQVLADWTKHAAALEPQMAAFPPIAVGQMVSDAFTHEQDIRGALRAPGGSDSAALEIAFDWSTERLNDRMAANNEGTLVLKTEAGTKTLGAGDPVTHLRANRLEILRAATGRRSRAQLDALDRDGPFDPEALLLSATIFTPATTDLVE
ncbi:MAG: maleylpyruvate isomerase family mycothiol-dependent enzyme [Acidimicrobiia bacterium]|nr:maleylpyruvate isomerase family mycothiol-dependent enzyme [Acidimicrobiia bacterium]